MWLTVTAFSTCVFENCLSKYSLWKATYILCIHLSVLAFLTLALSMHLSCPKKQNICHPKSEKCTKTYCNYIHTSDFLSSVSKFHVTYVSLTWHDMLTENCLLFPCITQKNFPAIKVFKKTITIIRNDCFLAVFSTLETNYLKPC